MNRDRMTSRHPFEIFLLVLSIISGLPVVFGKAPPPGSLQALVPGWVSLTWSVTLVLGSCLALLGVGWPAPRDKTKVSVTGVSLEQIGLVAVAGAAAFFVAAIAASHAPGTLVGGGIIAAYAGSCGWRAVQLQRLLRGPRAARRSRGAP